MEITFLGTGTSQGIPVIGSKHPVCLSNDHKDKRLRVSIHLKWNDFSFVVDCGPDFRQQMLNSECTKLDGLLFTHEHADHTAGLDDIRPFYFKQGDINLYAHDRVFKSLEKRFDYIFETENKYPGAPGVKKHVVNENVPFSLGGRTIIPINGLHDKLQVFGYRFDDFAYLTDFKTIETSELNKLKGVHTLVVNALRITPHISHFNLEEAINFIEKVNPKKAYLTHISHLMGFHEEVESKLPSHIRLAYDNLKITL